jgi:hypothetical protein
VGLRIMPTSVGLEETKASVEKGGNSSSLFLQTLLRLAACSPIDTVSLWRAECWTTEVLLMFLDIFDRAHTFKFSYRLWDTLKDSNSLHRPFVSCEHLQSLTLRDVGARITAGNYTSLLVHLAKTSPLVKLRSLVLSHTYSATLGDMLPLLNDMAPNLSELIFDTIWESIPRYSIQTSTYNPVILPQLQVLRILKFKASLAGLISKTIGPIIPLNHQLREMELRPCILNATSLEKLRTLIKLDQFAMKAGRVLLTVDIRSVPEGVVALKDKSSLEIAALFMPNCYARGTLTLLDVHIYDPLNFRRRGPFCDETVEWNDKEQLTDAEERSDEHYQLSETSESSIEYDSDSEE